jgi:hypothetical protein
MDQSSKIAQKTIFNNLKVIKNNQNRKQITISKTDHEFLAFLHKQQRKLVRVILYKQNQKLMKKRSNSPPPLQTLSDSQSTRISVKDLHLENIFLDHPHRQDQQLSKKSTTSTQKNPAFSKSASPRNSTSEFYEVSSILIAPIQKSPIICTLSGINKISKTSIFSEIPQTKPKYKPTIPQPKSTKTTPKIPKTTTSIVTTENGEFVNFHTPLDQFYLDNPGFSCKYSINDPDIQEFIKLGKIQIWDPITQSLITPPLNKPTTLINQSTSTTSTTSSTHIQPTTSLINQSQITSNSPVSSRTRSQFKKTRKRKK